MTLEILLGFAITEFLLSLVPGPAVFLVVSQGMKYGYPPSIKGTIGILTGNVIYFSLSALGLGTVLVASSTLFTAIRWIGASYLIFLGLKMLLHRRAPNQLPEESVVPLKSINLFIQGLITQLSNPKALIFFTALLPQFVSSDGSLVGQFALLGAVSVLVEFPVLLGYGWVAERGKRLIFKGQLGSLTEKIAGLCLIGVGVGLVSIKKP